MDHKAGASIVALRHGARYIERAGAYGSVGTWQQSVFPTTRETHLWDVALSTTGMHEV
jgi:hypothetical protein